jgi:threonine/homoserine/homoserine lactone efflux protein
MPQLFPEAHQLGVFVLASLVLLVVPGPSVLYIVSRSTANGARAGLASMTGVHAGTLVHVCGAVAGLSALIATSATLYAAVKLAGAVYLVYLGARTLLARPAAEAEAGFEGVPRHVRTRRLFVDGLVVEALNPKTAVFFLALLPQFVNPSTGPAWTQSLALGLVFIGLAVVSDGAYALLSARAAGWARRRNRGRLLPRLRWFEGGLLVALGLASAAGARTQP